MAGRSCLDQAYFVMCTELATVHVAEVNLHSSEFDGKPLENAAHFLPNDAGHLSIDRDILVAADLNLHTPSSVSPLPPAWAISFIFLIVGSIPAAGTLFLG
jgi:hypothetical protein